MTFLFMFFMFSCFSCFHVFHFQMDALDYKVTKKAHPIVNQASSLEFKFEKDANLHLRKDKILITGAIEVHEDFVVENGFVAKLFNSLTIEVDAQQVSINKVAGDYWLSDYIYKYGNFNFSQRGWTQFNQ